jgi:hypothetical protein
MMPSSRTPPRVTLRGFLKQHWTYGRGAVYLHRARDRRGVARPRLEPLRFYTRLIFQPIGKGFGWRTPVLVVLAALSQIVYGTGYYVERARVRLLGQASRPDRYHATSVDERRVPRDG